MNQRHVSTLKVRESALLEIFQSNPFRLFRLDLDASVDDALVAVERIRTLYQGGFEPPRSDPLPWLSDADETEIQQAAQQIDDSTTRLLAQLFWFDDLREAEGDLLRNALLDPTGEDGERYLMLPDRITPHWHSPESAKMQSSGPEGLAETNPACCADETAKKDKAASTIYVPEMAAIEGAVARSVNKSNLRLLAAAALLNTNTSPTFPDMAALEEAAKEADAHFNVVSRPWTIANAHLAVAEMTYNLRATVWDRDTDRAADLLCDAIVGWKSLLIHPWFHEYVRLRIEEIGDDLLTEDDIETLSVSVRTQLADLLVSEMRTEYLDGEQEAVNALGRAAARTLLDRRVWVLAFRPMRHLFKSELQEFGDLTTLPDDLKVADIKIVLARLQPILYRWNNIDPDGLIGLHHVFDEAVERCFQALLRAASSAEADRGQIPDALAMTASLANSNSLTQRILKEQESAEARKRELCHFCSANPGELNSSIALRGKKETHRERNLNVETTYYSLRWELVLRCKKCLERHQYIKNLKQCAIISLLPAALLIFLVFVRSLGPLPTLVGIGLIVGAILWAAQTSAEIARSEVIPKGHRNPDEFEESEAYKRLSSAGYSIIANTNANAYETMQNEIKANQQKKS